MQESCTSKDIRFPKVRINQLGAPNKIDISPFTIGPSRKFQNDFCITVCKKDIYPAFKEELKNNSTMYTYSDKTGNKEKSVLNINHRGWMRTCHKLQPVYSRYYRWVVDGYQSIGECVNTTPGLVTDADIKAETDPVKKATLTKDKPFPAGYVSPNRLGTKSYNSVNVMEMGHWEFHEFNKQHDNNQTTLNDTYMDGCIVSVMGTNQPAIMGNNEYHAATNSTFDDFYMRTVI